MRRTSVLVLSCCLVLSAAPLLHGAGAPRQSAVTATSGPHGDYRQLLISGTFEPHGDLDPQAYRRYVENEIARWAPIVKTLGLKID